MRTRDPLRVDPIYYVNIDNMNKNSFLEAWMDVGIDSPIQGRLQRMNSEAVACFQNRCMLLELNSIDSDWIQSCVVAFIRTSPMDLKWLPMDFSPSVAQPRLPSYLQFCLVREAFATQSQVPAKG